MLYYIQTLKNKHASNIVFPQEQYEAVSLSTSAPTMKCNKSPYRG